jgi:hypothetical protein
MPWLVHAVRIPFDQPTILPDPPDGTTWGYTTGDDELVATVRVEITNDDALEMTKKGIPTAEVSTKLVRRPGKDDAGDKPRRWDVESYTAPTKGKGATKS